MYKIRSVLNKLILTHIIISYYYYDVIKDTYRDTYKSSINTYKVTQTEQNKLIIVEILPKKTYYYYYY